MIFTAKIKAPTRKEIIKELRWFVRQLELDADGGGTYDDRVTSTWKIATRKGR